MSESDVGGKVIREREENEGLCIEIEEGLS